MLAASYRKNYAGEFVVYDAVLSDGKFEERREWIANSVINDSHNGVAVVIGNGTSSRRLNLQLLSAHMRFRPDLRLQTYGANALIRDFSPDFLVVNSDCMVSEVLAIADLKKTIVYTSAKNILAHPNRFHLIPQNLNWNAGAVATFLACFDGHKKVFLLGFDNQAPGKNNNVYAGTACYDSVDSAVSSEKWERTMYSIFRAYPDVEFVRIRPSGPTPESWLSCLNFRQITQREFVLEADL